MVVVAVNKVGNFIHESISVRLSLNQVEDCS